MGKCNLDHSLEDVKKKYESQLSFLPDELKSLFDEFFQKEHTQELLNEVFHLLKKFDLVSKEEQDERIEKLMLITKHTK
ncbi:group-specific protein [Bacillus sp. DNRA2]|uniref:group-specific protein n=1 Tax=Bacillus sp. DNRA2 TaxID=2723053 RepID=UPI00145E8D3E|nr:group-specific protein [Bacillus sp. DNRA2]NMD69193.1 group-specific protein [Bacillus sp. DNRA2]